MRVDVKDLVGRPGATRDWRGTVTPDDDDLSWGPAESALAGPIRCDLTLDAVMDGILVRGSIVFPTEIPCARCLEPQQTSHRVWVSEMFRDPTRPADESASSPDSPHEEDEEAEQGYEIVENLTTLDLTRLLHDTVVMDIPLRILCRDECRGLCPVCGTDRNEEDCGHDPSERPPDPRWSKLEELDVPPA